MEQISPKVSIIVPCYNSEKYLDVFFQGILSDSHTNIELIMVNDGSTDHTEDKILSYKPKIDQRGGELIYIKQKNAGAAEAINSGLKVFTGDYLIWPDSDDELINNSIGDRVDYMERHPDIAILLTNFITVHEAQPDTVVEHSAEMFASWNEDTFFKDFLNGNAGVGPPYYIARSEIVLHQIPDRTIYNNRSGQNYQLVLPLAFGNKVAIWRDSKPYYKYYLRPSSHSHTNKQDRKTTLVHFQNVGENIYMTIEKIPNMTSGERLFYKKKAIDLQYNLSLNACFEYGARESFMRLFSQLRAQNGTVWKRNRIKWWIWHIPGSYRLVKWLKRL